MNTPRGFRAPVAARIVGLRYHQLDYYDKKGLVRPSLASAHGHGSRRIYSFADLVGLRVIREMLDQGLSVQRIRKAVTVLRREWPKAGDLGSGARIVTDGKGAWLALDAERLVSLLDAPGQTAWRSVVDVSRIVGEVRATIEREDRKAA